MRRPDLVRTAVSFGLSSLSGSKTAGSTSGWLMSSSRWLFSVDVGCWK